MQKLIRAAAAAALVLQMTSCKEGEQRFDFDEDGWEDSIDCGPQDPHTYPGAPEIPDCRDNNCDGVMDEGTVSIDSDLDGYCVGVVQGDVTTCCDDAIPGDCSDIDASLHPVDEDGDGFSPCDGDCDEGDDTIHPDAVEICDGRDNDCDGEAGPFDESDEDGDGYPACSDCDDSDPDINPGVIDLANDGVDTNCDDVDGMDTDGDGYASQDSGGEDCNDLDGAIFPGAEELCDGLDNDCDGYLDEGLAVDQDGDGYNACSGECDDTDPLTHPDAPELCDGVDNDCDGVVPADELDGDADGVMVCGGDCDDADDIVNPSAAEVCADGADNDCDGVVDNADCIHCTAWIPGDYPTIQLAANAAGIGDTLCVEPGTYAEHVQLDVGEVSLVGIGGPAATIIDGTSSGRPLTVEGYSGVTVLQGFTLTQGVAPNEAVPGGGGLRVNAINVALRDLVILGNHSDHGGGGVLCYVCDAYLENVVIQGNTTDSYGGGIEFAFSLSAGQHVIVEGNTSQNDGGGIYVNMSDLALDNSQLVENTAIDGYGGGVSTYSGTLVAEHLTAEGNWGRYSGGAVLSGSSSDVALVNSRLVGNEVFTWGGAGACAWSGALYLENTVVVGNTANGDGGGVSVLQQGALEAINTIISDNTAAAGGGVDVFDGAATFDSCNIWGNAGGDVNGITDPVGQDGNLSLDPAFEDSSDPAARNWDLHLSDTSPLIEAGSQGLADPDNSASDIGCYGGPGADGFDHDQDGYYEWWQPGAYDFGAYPGLGYDCDDDDALIYPGLGC